MFNSEWASDQKPLTLQNCRNVAAEAGADIEEGVAGANKVGNYKLGWLDKTVALFASWQNDKDGGANKI